MTAYLVMVFYFYRIWRLWTTSTYPDIMSIGTQYCTNSHTIVTFKYISNQEGRDIGLLRLSTSIGPGETVFFRSLSSSIIKLTITIVVKIMKYSRMTYEELLANTSWGSPPASSLCSKSFRSESRSTRVSRSPLWRRWTEATVWTILKQNRVPLKPELADNNKRCILEYQTNKDQKAEVGNKTNTLVISYDVERDNEEHEIQVEIDIDHLEILNGDKVSNGHFVHLFVP